MAIVKATVKLRGTKGEYRAEALVDSGARMSLLDKSLAENIGVEYTERTIDFVSISGHVIKGQEAVTPELRIEDEVLKYAALAIAEIQNLLRKRLRKAD